MRTTETSTIIPVGMDTRNEADPRTFAFAENVTFDADLDAWVTDVGTEPLRPHTASRVYAAYERTNPIHSVHAWTFRGVEHLLYEQDHNDTANPGVGLYVHQLDGTDTELAVRRTAPSYDEPGTQYVRMGTSLLVLNGTDRPLKFHGDASVSPFGFLAPPPAPGVVGVDPSQMAIQNSQRGGESLTAQGIGLYPQVQEDTYSFDQVFWDAGGGVAGWGGVATANSYYGLGLTADGDINAYNYKVAYVSDTGSISPLSAAASVRWVIPDQYLGGTGENNEGRPNPAGIKFAILIDALPVGPANTVARILYRTRNLRDGILGAGETYYTVATIPDNTCTTFVDFIPDNELIEEAPTGIDASTISQDHRVGVIWDGRLWLGGSSDQKLIYSQRGFPEQFGAASFFDMSARDGGEVTALVSYQASLLIFRERSIEVVTPSRDASVPYRLSVLHPALGTTATNSIKPVPGVGICFLARDGIYALSGNLDGGSTPNVTRISDPVQSILSRLNKPALPRAVAAYSDDLKEYWVHFPADGSDVASLGLVLHLPTGGWSVRGEAYTSDDSGLWGIRSMTTDRWGQTLLAPEQVTVDSRLYNVGLHIVSRASTLSVGLSGSASVEGGTTYTTATPREIRSTLVSQWVRHDRTKAAGLTVDLVVLEGVSDGVNVGHMVDERFTFNTSTEQNVSLVHPDDQGTANASPLWGTSALTSAKPLAVYGSSVIGNDRRTLIRVDLYADSNVRDSVCWYYQDTQPICLRGWRWGLVGTERPQMKNRWGA